jgi:hypothetical protein
VRSIGARYLQEHRPAGPTSGSPRHVAFAAFLRGTAAAADLPGEDLAFVRGAAWRVSTGRALRPGTLARIAGMLGVPAEELLERAPGGGTSPAARLVTRALARIGATRAELAARVGVSPFALRLWLAGAHRPSPGHLERLVAALDEPRLRRLMPTASPVGEVRLTCRRCGEARAFWPSKVKRTGPPSRPHPDWAPVVDWASMTGAYTCRGCRDRRAR